MKNSLDELDKDTLRQLYSLFHLQDETYIYTVKLNYIYTNIQPYSREHTFDTIERLMIALQGRRSSDTLDNLHRFIQTIRFQNYDTAKGIPPDRSGYIRGHRL